MVIRQFVVVCLFLLSTSAVAADYELPADAGSLPGNCSASGDFISCSGNLILGNKDSISVTEEVTLSISGDFTFGNGLEVNLDRPVSDMNIEVAGNMNPGNNAIINASLSVSGNINSQNNGALNGDITVTGTLNLGNNSVVEGNITATNVNVSNNVQITGNIDADNINLGQNILVEGNISTDNININGSNTVIDGNINATGTVNNNGTVTGYVNAENINDNGNGIDDDSECDIDTSEGPNTGGCFGSSTISRFLLSHSGTTLTCESHTVEVTACSNSDCSQQQPITGSVDVKVSNGEAVTATFSGTAQTQVELSIFPAGTYNLTTDNSSGVSPNAATICNPDCSVEAVDTGLLFSGEQTQLAGELFDLRIRAVRTNTQTRACEAAVQGGRNMDLSLICVDPSSCLSPVSIDGATIDPSGTIPVEFDAEGEAVIESVSYKDAGLIQLTASVGVGTGAILQGDSAPFVVKPAAIGINVFSAGGLTNDGESVLAVAETPFQVRLTPLTDNGETTPNFGNETSPYRLIVRDFDAQTYRAVDENNQPIDSAALSNKNAFSFDNSNNQFVNTSIEFNEVGVIRLIADIEGQDYLGGGNTSSISDDVGRFIPAYFDIEQMAVKLEDATSDFTYFGQETFFDIPPSWNLIVYGAKGGVIDNYKGPNNLRYPDNDYPSGLNVISQIDESSLSLFINDDAKLESSNDGVEASSPEPLRIGVTNLSLLFEKTVDGLPPTESSYRIELSEELLTDKDGVCFASQATPEQCQSFSWLNQPENDTELLYGRLKLLDNAGSENEPLAADLVIEYFETLSDRGYFVKNSRDMDTVYGISWLDGIVCESPNSNDEIIIASSGLDAESVISGESIAGSLQVEPPQEICEAVWTFDLVDKGLGYLKFNWDGNGELTDPEAMLYFGRYSGNDRQIYWREVGW